MRLLFDHLAYQMPVQTALEADMVTGQIARGLENRTNDLDLCTNAARPSCSAFAAYCLNAYPAYIELDVVGCVVRSRYRSTELVPPEL